MSDDQQPGHTSAETINTAPAEPMIPKSRFDEINAKLRKLEADAAQRQAEQQRAADEAAAKRGEFETLANERAAKLAKTEAEKADADAQLTAYRGVLEQQVKARLKALPEAARAKLPDADPLSQIAWLDAVEAAVAATAPAMPRGTPTGPRGSGSEAPPRDLPDLRASKMAHIDYGN